jgi:hypothetical protein
MVDAILRHDIATQQQADGESTGQSNNIDRSKALVFEQVAVSDEEVVFYHLTFRIGDE